MKYLLSSLVLLVASTLAFAAPPKVVIPDKVKPQDGYVILVPDTDAVNIIYISLDGLTPFPNALLKDTRSLVIPVKGEKPGAYRFVAVASSKEGDLVRVDFTIILDGPPVPPPPTDPDIQALKDAFSKETGATKVQDVATLASLYRMAASTTVRDTTITTVGGLFQDLKAASASLLKPDAVPLVRKVIGDRLNKVVGTDVNAALNRDAVAAEFNKIASYLEGLK